MRRQIIHTLVTGGAGFIGSTLVDRLLHDGHSVDVVDDLSTGSLDHLELARQVGGAFHFEQLDVRDPRIGQFVVERAPEVIYHLAAQSSVAVSVNRPAFDADVNVVGSLQLFDAARVAGVKKVVFAASGGTLYGDLDPEELPVSEDHVYSPTSPYGISKKVVVDYLIAYERLYGLASTALALANVYGPRQDPHGEAGVVAIFADNLIAGRPSRINGDGAQTRDFVYVDDVVDAFVRAGSSTFNGVVNIGSGTETSITWLFELLSQAAGMKGAAEHGPPKSGEVRQSSLDPTLAANCLGWKSETPLMAGLSAVVDASRRLLGRPDSPPESSPAQ